MADVLDHTGRPIVVGATVRTVQTRGCLTKSEAGRNYTVRAVVARADRKDELREVRVDNGDPKVDDLVDNGSTDSRWPPGRALEVVGGHRG